MTSIPPRPLALAFRRAGYAALADLGGEGYAELFGDLEAVQREFLAGVPEFRDGAYPWGEDTLHAFARPWEYAYAYYHIAGEQRRAHTTLAVADLAAGCTFFPLVVARTGARVCALEADPAVVRDLQNAAQVVSPAPGRLDVRPSGARLPFPAGSVDVAYAIGFSAPDPAAAVADLVRVLKPGGLVVLTVEVGSDGQRGMPAGPFDALRDALAESFAWLYPERTIHPADLLTSKSSPWKTGGARRIPLLSAPSPEVLTVYGCVLRRR